MKQYRADAFANQLFKGNPAAVIVQNQFPDEELMINITKENQLSETAFVVPFKDHYHIRWFTPGGEINLCGHATLASAYIIMNFYDQADQVVFESLSGKLKVLRKDDIYTLDLPAYELKSIPITNEMVQAIGAMPIEAYLGEDLVLVFDDEITIRKAQPDLEKVKQLPGLLTHITARGDHYDCVTRSFAPKLNVAEDPVCGRGHCHVIPYWNARLGENDMIAYQASERGGVLYCSTKNDRVYLGGRVKLFSIDDLQVD